MDTFTVAFVESPDMWVRIVRAAVIVLAVLAAVSYLFLFRSGYTARNGSDLRVLMLGSVVVFVGVAINNIYRIIEEPAPGVYLILVGMVLVGVGMRHLVRVNRD